MIRRSEQLEVHLLRKGVGALAAERDRCDDCGRTPLIGEHVLRYEDGGTACELCGPLRRERAVRHDLVRHCEHGHAVRLTARVAA